MKSTTQGAPAPSGSDASVIPPGISKIASSMDVAADVLDCVSEQIEWVGTIASVIFDIAKSATRSNEARIAALNRIERLARCAQFLTELAHSDAFEPIPDLRRCSDAIKNRLARPAK